MRLYQKFFIKSLNLFISSKFRHLLLRLIGLNNYFSLVMKSIDIRGNTTAQKNILCIERSLFEKDIEELSYRVRKYGWIWLRKSQFTVYQDNLIEKKYRGQKNYFNHINKTPTKWRECIRRSKILLRKFKKEHNVCAVLLANINYWQDYSLQVACKELDIPVIVLQKEYPYNDFDNFQSFKNYYTKNFTPIADAIMVFGKRAKNIFSDIQNFDKNKIFVTGAPRLDRWRSLEQVKGVNNGLLIISFKDDENKIEPFLDMLVIVSNYIKKQNLGIIKIKSRNENQKKQLLEFCKKENLTNIEIILHANIYDLVLQSKAIISSNSLATVESMLSKVPILIPDWIIKNKNKKMFNPEDDICFKSLEFSENIESLQNNILKYLKEGNGQVSEETFEAREKFISKFWEYDPKVTACSNVQDVIDSFVK